MDEPLEKPEVAERYLTIKAAAKLLGVSPSTLRNWDRTGKFTAKRHPINRYRVYAHADVAELVALLQTAGRPAAGGPNPSASLEK